MQENHDGSEPLSIWLLITVLIACAAQIATVADTLADLAQHRYAQAQPPAPDGTRASANW